MFTILKEIPQYAGSYTWKAYDSLKAILESGLVTETNHEEVFTILKEIPQYARSDTHDAYKSLLGVLELMKQKNLALDQDSLKVILNIIREGGKDSGVKNTLNAIRDFISTNVKDPAPEAEPGFSNTLEALLNPTPIQLPKINIIKDTLGLTKTHRSDL